MSENEFEVLFRDFTAEEFQKLSGYFGSPFFEIPKRIRKLHDLVEASRKNGGTCTLTRDEICSHFYPGEEPAENYHNLRKMISEYKSKTEEFTSFCEFSTDQISKDKAKLKWLRRKRDRTNYKKNSEKLLEYINKYSEHDDLYYYEKMQILMDKFNFLSGSINIESELEPAQINKYLDKHFLANKLYLFQIFTSLRYTNNTDIEGLETFKQSIIGYIEQNRDEIFSNDPEICFRYLGYLLNANGFDKDIYTEYLNSLTRFGKDFRVNENGYYYSLLNLLSLFINQGNTGLDNDILKLAELMDERGIIEKYDISFIDMKIIIESAIGLQQYDWALGFVEKFRDNLKEAERKNQYLLLKGKIQFFKGELDEAGRLLSQVKDENFIHYVEVRMLELRILIVKKDFYSIDEYIQKTRKYQKAHTEIGTHYANAYSLFMVYIARYANIKRNSRDQSAYEFEMIKLEADLVNETNSFYACRWLIDLVKNERQNTTHKN